MKLKLVACATFCSLFAGVSSCAHESETYATKSADQFLAGVDKSFVPFILNTVSQSLSDAGKVVAAESKKEKQKETLNLLASLVGSMAHIAQQDELNTAEEKKKFDDELAKFTDAALSLLITDAKTKAVLMKSDEVKSVLNDIAAEAKMLSIRDLMETKDKALAFAKKIIVAVRVYISERIDEVRELFTGKALEKLTGKEFPSAPDYNSFAVKMTDTSLTVYSHSGLTEPGKFLDLSDVSKERLIDFMINVADVSCDFIRKYALEPQWMAFNYISALIKAKKVAREELAVMTSQEPVKSEVKESSIEELIKSWVADEESAEGFVDELFFCVGELLETVSGAACRQMELNVNAYYHEAGTPE
ncbi:hypothetical protein HOD08_03770 [bacterium]|nr:hypothetical protein [bacterium]